MALRNFTSVLLLSFLFAFTSGKEYGRCELARELKNVHKAPLNQLATWVCLAKHEANYNTNLRSRINSDGSRDYGIFQINDRYWCYPPGRGCGLRCSGALNGYIGDDFRCAQRIFRDTSRRVGNGFNAWSSYSRYCMDSRVDKFLDGCF